MKSDFMAAINQVSAEKGISKEVARVLMNGMAKRREDRPQSYREVIEAAMLKEREAVATYEKLSIYVDDPEAKRVFQLLLEEEKKHLKGFETEYDDLTNQSW